MANTEKVICSTCGTDCSNQFWMCDEIEGTWCPECFDKTPCGKGEHGEGCPTQALWVDTRNEGHSVDNP